MNFGRHRARSRKNHWKNGPVFTDSLEAFGAFDKGRSSAPPLLALCRRMPEMRIGAGLRRNSAGGPMRGHHCWAAPETKANHATRPVRGQG